MKITCKQFVETSFKDFLNRKNVSKMKIGYYEISETFFLFKKSLKLVSTNCLCNFHGFYSTEMQEKYK